MDARGPARGLINGGWPVVAGDGECGGCRQPRSVALTSTGNIYVCLRCDHLPQSRPVKIRSDTV